MQKSTTTFTHLQRVDSTNNYAMGKVHAGMANHGDAYFTMNQTQGKGQRGKQWMGGSEENIAISIVIAPSVLGISQQFALSAAVAVATHQFFSSYAGDETSIKWPNDIYWRDRKAAGVLIENVIGQQRGGSEAAFWKNAVAGIGININQTLFDKGLINPVSLKQITGFDYDCVTLAKELHGEVMNAVNITLQSGASSVLDYYNQHLYKKEEWVVFKKGSFQFSTQIKSVSAAGQLLTTDIVDNSFDFGEVEWVL